MEYLEKMKAGLKARAFDFNLIRMEDLEPVLEEYHYFFQTFADYCFLVDSVITLSQLFLLAEEEKLFFSGINSSEELMEAFS